MWPPVMPKCASMPGGVNGMVSTTSSDVPGAYRSQISSSRDTYPGSSASHEEPAGAYGTDCTNSADEWCPASSRSDSSTVVCTYHSIVGSAGNRPACTSAHIARNAAIGESCAPSSAEPGSRWIVAPNGDRASSGRQEKCGRPD